MGASYGREAGTRRRRPRLCFVAHNAYGALSGQPTRHSGGIERQQSLHARWFAAHGYDTSLVTWNEGQDDGAVLAGVRIWRMCRQDDGLPGLRFIHPRWTSLHRALARADADIYHYATGDMGLGQIALFCRLRRRACVYQLSSNWGADRTLPHLRPQRERILHRYGLRRADRVIVQTAHQQRMLREGFGLESIQIPMPCQELAETDYVAPPAPQGGAGRVLWVGRYSDEKRLEWLLDAAERCHEASFDVVGAANAQTPYTEALARRAAAIPNVILHGRVSDNAVLAALYRRASLFCCTSSSEGFPNTFLEAWSHGLPIVSTFDPDGVIGRLGLGTVAADVTSLLDGIRTLLRSPERHRQASENARRYFVENHAVGTVLPRIEGILLELYASREQGALGGARLASAPRD